MSKLVKIWKLRSKWFLFFRWKDSCPNKNQWEKDKKKKRTGFLGVDVEGVVGVGLALAQGSGQAAGDGDFLGVADFALAHVDLERRAGDVLAHAFNGHVVVARLAGSERNACIVCTIPSSLEFLLISP